MTKTSNGRKPKASPIFTAANKKKVLAGIEQGMSMATAAKSAGITRRTVSYWKKNDPEFADDFRDAAEASIDILEEEAYRRARKQSDTMLIFVLKSRRREIYGDRSSVDHTHTYADPRPELERLFDRLAAQVGSQPDPERVN